MFDAFIRLPGASPVPTGLMNASKRSISAKRGGIRRREEWVPDGKAAEAQQRGGIRDNICPPPLLEIGQHSR